MNGRLGKAADLMHALEMVDVQLVFRDGSLAFRFGPTAPPMTPGVAQRVLSLEPELLSIVGWSKRPVICPACAATDFYGRVDGTYGCAGCWPDAAALLDGKPTLGRAVAHA